MRKRRVGIAIALIATLAPLSIQSLLAAAPITNGLLVSVDATSGSISGTTWSAADGTSYPATLQASGMYTSPNNFVSFGDSTNQWANFGNIGSTASDISVDMWFYIGTMHTTGWNILATKWFEGVGTDWHFGFYMGKLRNYFYNLNYVEDGVNGVGGSGWYHAAFTIKQPSEGTCPGTNTSGTSTIFVNGIQVGSLTSTVACHITSSSSFFVIGDRRSSANLGIDGKVSKFRFYTRSLSPAEVNKLYRADAATYGLSAAPYNSAAPSFTGFAKVGSPQSGSNGTWLNGVSGYTYRWYRADTSSGSYLPISGATSINYSPVTGDLSKYLKFEVTATNAQGSISETSTATLISQAESNLSLTASTAMATSRTIRNLTLSPGASGKVTFTNNGKKIPGCIGLSSNAGNSYSVTCPWRASVIGYNNVAATYTSSDAAYPSGSTQITTIFVQKRSGTR